MSRGDLLARIDPRDFETRVVGIESRIGEAKAQLAAMETGARPEDLAILVDIAGKMEGQTICAFADAAAWPVQGLMRHFRADFEAHIEQKKCPFSESFAL